LLKPASEKLKTYLENIEFHVPTIPVINNVDVSILDNPAAIKNALVRQAAKPVRWQETIRAMSARGVIQVVECGPGKVLAGLTKRIDDQLQGMALMDDASLMEVIQTLKS